MSAEREEETCWRCGSTEIWVPTFCNWGHCAACFAPLDPIHRECAWDGREHESYGPSDKLPGNVYVEDLDEC